MMKPTRAFIAFIGLLALCVVAPAVAQDSPIYLGLKAGTLAADFPGFESATGAGATLGYDLHQDSSGALALETEFISTLGDGDIDRGGGWDADAVGAYAGYRTAGNVYLKAKAGVLQQHVNRSGGTSANDGTDSGLAYGAGVGWRITHKAALEVEYALLSDDLSFLSFAYVTHF